MPIEYSTINHGRFCQLMADLALSPDDAANLLNVNASTIKRWYKGIQPIPTERLKQLEAIYTYCLKLVASQLELLMVTPKHKPLALVICTTQQDMETVSPSDPINWIPYKTLNMIQFKLAETLRSKPYELEVYIIPFESELYRYWQYNHPGHTGKVNPDTWAQAILDKELS